MVNQLRHSDAIAPIIQFSGTVQSKQVATSARQVTKLKLVSLGGAAHVSVYDTANGDTNPINLKWVLDSSMIWSDTDDFVNPLDFKRGIYLTCDDGSLFKPQVCVAYIP